MGSGNQVILTFGGDEKGAVESMKRVGGASEDMGRKVTESGDAFDRVGERADDVDTKAMGFRDTLTGLQDSTKGLKMVASGNWGFESLLTLGAGIGDLGSGIFNFVTPAFKSFTTAIKGMNLAFLTSPITWIIIGIVALVAVIVLIATKTDWFSRGWAASWSWMKSAASNTWDFIKRIPGWIGDAFSSVATAITAPFRFAFNQISRLWNGTIGSLSWTVPGWIPFIGGNTISVPNLPTFHAGGRVPGYPGEAVPIMAQAGEEVLSAGSSSGRGGRTVYVRGDALVDMLIDIIGAAVHDRGGDVQLVLGGSNA